MALITGCQKEYNKISEPDKTITISSGDTVADLIRKVVLKDGSFDNVIDHCNAISIKFPYSIQINGQVFQINSLNDIEMIKQNYIENWEDIIITFPVTIIYNDYSESILNNEAELQALQEKYNTNLIDDDIECLDFVYPIDLCLYNTVFQNADCITVNNDFELYNIFRNINDTVIELGYPLQVKTLDNFFILVNNNTELKNQILSYMNSCDENDEVAFDTEQDSVDTSSDDITYLTSGKWKITLLTDDESDETASFSSWLFQFNSDSTTSAITALKTIKGSWVINLDEGTKVLKIDFGTYREPLESLSGEWEILKLNNDALELQAESESETPIKLNMAKSD